jgi:hypothetical protein
MAEMNEGRLSTLPSIVATPSHDRTPSNEVSPISASETSTAHQAFYIDCCLALPGQND